MAYLGPVRSIINAHVQCYVRPVPLSSPVFLNPTAVLPDRGWNLPPPLHQFIAKKTIFQI